MPTDQNTNTVEEMEYSGLSNRELNQFSRARERMDRNPVCSKQRADRASRKYPVGSITDLSRKAEEGREEGLRYGWWVLTRFKSQVVEDGTLF